MELNSEKHECSKNVCKKLQCSVPPYVLKVLRITMRSIDPQRDGISTSGHKTQWRRGQLHLLQASLESPKSAKIGKFRILTGSDFFYIKVSRTFHPCGVYQNTRVVDPVQGCLLVFRSPIKCSSVLQRKRVFRTSKQFWTLCTCICTANMTKSHLGTSLLQYSIYFKESTENSWAVQVYLTFP